MRSSKCSVVNLGLPLLCQLRESETDVRNRVAEIAVIQSQIAVDLSLSDGAERAERLRPICRLAHHSGSDSGAKRVG
jgi:hypothetical protein